MKIMGFAAALAAFAALCAPAHAEHKRHSTAGGVKISASFARATPGPVKNGAVYLSIANTGSGDDRLIGAKSPAARKTELHTHEHKGGVARMRAIEGGVGLSSGQSHEFKPGGDHIMLLGLHKPLKEGEKFPVTLIFENAGEITVHVPVKGVAARDAGDSGHGSHDRHGGKKHSR